MRSNYQCTVLFAQLQQGFYEFRLSRLGRFGAVDLNPKINLKGSNSLLADLIKG